MRRTPSNVGSLLALVATSCVYTGDLGSSSFELCPSQARPGDEPGALLVLTSNIDGGTLNCSAVAIAPTLAVTSIGCVFRPSVLDDPQPIRSQGPFLYFAGVDFETTCDPDRNWIPAEEGNFAASFGKRIANSEMTVNTVGAPRRHFAVKEVFTSAASSRCTPGIALLLLDAELGTAGLAVRLTETHIGDPVKLAGHCANPGLRLREQDSFVEAISSAEGTDLIPPETSLLTHAVSGDECGGGVLSSDTGALVAVIASGHATSCDETDPNAKTVAVRLAPFRTMLLETARAKGITLHSEFDPTTPVRDAGAGCPAIDSAHL